MLEGDELTRSFHRDFVARRDTKAGRERIAPGLAATPQRDLLSEGEWPPVADLERLGDGVHPDCLRARRHDLVPEHRADAAVREPGGADEAFREYRAADDLTVGESQLHVGSHRA